MGDAQVYYTGPATTSPEAGDYRFKHVTCQPDWSFQPRDCLSCSFCPRNSMAPGYPYGPYQRNQPLMSAGYPTPIASAPFPPMCTMGPTDFIAPPGSGLYSVKVAEPNVWAVVPANIPASVVIGAYHHGDYIDQIYLNRRGKPFNCCAPRCAGETAVIYEPRIITLPPGSALDLLDRENNNNGNVVITVNRNGNAINNETVIIPNNNNNASIINNNNNSERVVIEVNNNNNKKNNNNNNGKKVVVAVNKNNTNKNGKKVIVKNTNNNRNNNNGNVVITVKK